MNLDERRGRDANLGGKPFDKTQNVECPRCYGNGEVCGVSPNRRSRFVGHDDLSPDDFTVTCPKCLGTGIVAYDPEEDCE